MRKISDTIARLAALRSIHASGRANSGGFQRLRPLSSRGSNPGALTANYYVPQNLPHGAPLVVVLHGCTQTTEGYDRNSGWSELANDAGFALLYPEQQRANNANLCFNWFLPPDTARGAGEALSIRQMLEAMVDEHALDRRRIFITGLSAGGAMASAMLATYPEAFAGGAIIAGLPYGSARSVPQAFDRMRGHGGPSQQELQRLLRRASTHEGEWPRISIWHGLADHTVAPSNADAIVAQWQGVHSPLKAPTRSEVSGRRSRRTWRNAAGEAVIELNTIAGMAHGTPLGQGLGSPGPFMLDVGISSTREIARFWNIEAADRKPAMSVGDEPPSQPLAHADTEASNARPVDDSRPNAHGVKRVIEDALRAAGLMR